MTKFTHTPYDIDAIARNGYGRITFKITGYWSNEMLTMYITEKYSFEGDNSNLYWDIEISPSSGGRDPKELKCNLLAAENYAAAINAAVEIGFDFKAAEDRMTKIRELVRAEDAAYREDEKREIVNAIAADHPLGEDTAARLVEKKITELKVSRKNVTIPFFTRGAKDNRHIYLELTPKGRVGIYDEHGRMSKDTTIAFLAKCSHRTFYAK